MPMLNIRLNASLYRAAQDRCDLCGVSMSEAVRHGVDDLLRYRVIDINGDLPEATPDVPQLNIRMDGKRFGAVRELADDLGLTVASLIRLIIFQFAMGN